MAILHQNITNLIDSWLEEEQKGDHFPVPFDIAWEIAGYSTKGNAKRKLTSQKAGLIEGTDYYIYKGVPIITSDKSGLEGRSADRVVLSCDAFKHFCLMAETEEGRLIRQYFIEAEKNWRMVKTKAPEIAQVIELERIRLDVERERNRGKEIDSAMVSLHGEQVVLALRGYPGAVIEKEVVLTEVLNAETGERRRFLSADQTKREIYKRTGQAPKSLKQVTDAVKDAGRADLLVGVQRPTHCEYIPPENLNEVLRVVYGGTRQKLIGE